MSLSPHARLGPYEVVELLGSGGMGEVYRARDPRLRRDVAVKVLPREFARDAARLRRFEQEARAVAALNHPYILTVFDVGEHDGTPYVVTELLEGETLREVLTRRSPTRRQILTFAVQAARGLTAAHQKGIVHRDIKPENLFVTTDGRVKILDFGLARVASTVAADSAETTQEDLTRPGMLLGTVAYMSPEQVEASAVDSRSDLFSFGVVLYELLSRTHPFRRDTVTATLTAILHETPPAPSSIERGISPALDGIVRRCLEKKREERFASAHELAEALEAVLKAPAGAASLAEVEERSPYPGLQSFTEKDAAVFFGREAEVKALWQRLQGRRLLAVIGPSGAGKTSFVRAGVVASKPEGWGVIACKPGAAPLRSLGQALGPALAGDAEALGRLAGFEDPETAFTLLSRWRQAHADALLVVDQFEELFTLDPQETQKNFSELLGRLASEADIHVLLSLRDDFLIRCSDHQPLGPVFSEITPLTALTKNGLERALVEPARKLGYRFEDGALVDEMVSAVEGVRGALPLLAFAVARLWEKRDRDRKLLTREAYEEIGGVTGALAQHAEATMDRIGAERHGIVREIFRNLVTAQGTRAVGDRDELLSAFPERAAADEVLRALIDARLLTTYEVEETESRPGRHRVEVVHESLLKAWPRLVRWQAQDEEGAVLRDQLKQAAHLWDEKSRTADLLWTGTAYQEFELWRERYAGKLTSLESDFARAMAEKAMRRKRLLTAIVASVIVAFAGVAIAIGTSRFQAVKARDKAEAEALRAEASKLLALARTEIDRYPTAALAYARKSLELADTPEARRFAVEVLWRGPVARILPIDRIAKQMGVPDDANFFVSALSPDGNWLAMQSEIGEILLFARDGTLARHLPAPPNGNGFDLTFGPRSDLLIASGSSRQIVRFLSVPDLRELRSVELGGVGSLVRVMGGRLFTLTRMSQNDDNFLIRAWPLSGGEPKTLARSNWSDIALMFPIDATDTWLAYGRGRTLFRQRLDVSGPSQEQVLGQLADDVFDVKFLDGGSSLLSVDKSRETRLWSLAQGTTARIFENAGGFGILAAEAKGSRFVLSGVNASVAMSDLRDPPDAKPVAMNRPEPLTYFEAALDPRGSWVATNTGTSVAFWLIGGPWMRTLRGRGGGMAAPSFSPDSRWLAICTNRQPARLWPLDASDGGVRTLTPAQPCLGLAIHPAGTHVLVGAAQGGGVFLYPFAGGSTRPLPTGWEGAVSTGTLAVAFDAARQRAAACPLDWDPAIRNPKLRVLKVWDLESGQDRTYSLAHLKDASWNGFEDLRFAADGSLYAAGQGVSHLVLPIDPGGTVSSDTLHASVHARLDLSRDGRQLLVRASQSQEGPFEELLVFDLAARTPRRITTHGQRLLAAVFDSTGRIVVTGDAEGVVRVGPVSGEEPHLLPGGHAGPVSGVAVSPDGRWIASVGDEAIHLWPMPDVTKPPLHTLPHAELMAKLDALTNLRVVPDPSTSTGWKLDIGPFTGWKDVPTW